MWLNGGQPHPAKQLVHLGRLGDFSFPIQLGPHEHWRQAASPEKPCVRAVLTLSLVPRSITMALALPISHQLGASAGITAPGVMLTGETPHTCLHALTVTHGR